jgi:von Willebrand factor A domain-containing protein 8
MSSRRRLEQLLAAFAPTHGVQSVGTLKLGDIAFPVRAAATPSRLPHSQPLLFNPAEDKGVANDLYFLLQKYVLGQDVFLLSQPGPYARRLAMTFCRCVVRFYV